MLGAGLAFAECIAYSQGESRTPFLPKVFTHMVHAQWQESHDTWSRYSGWLPKLTALLV